MIYQHLIEISISAPLKAPSGANSYWTFYISLDTALEQMVKTIPEITDQREIKIGEVGKRLNPSLVLGRAYVFSAMIVLHTIDAEKNPVAREKCVQASKWMARDVKVAGSTHFLYSHACLGVSVLKLFPV